jgi:hypothetical protein
MAGKKYEIIYLNPNDLIDYEYNNKIHSEAQINLLAELIKEVGFDVPVVADENKVIIKGHCRKYAAIKLGMKLVPCIVRDDIPEEIKRLARIADNKIPENSTWDYGNLREEINYLKEMDIDLNLTGFNENDILLITDINENFSFNDGIEDNEPLAGKDIEGKKDGRSYLCEISFNEKEDAENFLKALGMPNYKFTGMTKIVDGDKELIIPE